MSDLSMTSRVKITTRYAMMHVDARRRAFQLDERGAPRLGALEFAFGDGPVEAADQGAFPVDDGHAAAAQAFVDVLGCRSGEDAGPGHRAERGVPPLDRSRQGLEPL